MPPRRRLAIMGQYPVDRNPSGGIESVMLNLVDTLARDTALELHVVQHRQQVSAGAMAFPGFTLHNLPAAQKRLVPNTFRTETLARAWLAQVQPDAVISHHPSFALAAIAEDIPVVHTIHGMPTKEFWTRRGLFARSASLLEIWLEWRMLRRVSHIIAISDQMEVYYRHRTKAQFHRVNNPISLQFFQPSPPPQRFQALLVGHLNKRKGVDVAIRAIARLLPQFPQLRLDIIGRDDVDPAFTKLVRAQAQPLGEAIRFLGPMDQAGIRAAMARAQVFLLASRMENAPMVIAEAMATGRPVVATDVGGVATMIQSGVTGYLVPSEDDEALAAALARLLADADLATTMGAQAARFARAHYHPDAVAAGYLRAVQAAMSQPGASGLSTFS